METQEYINSGILELYVAGALSDEENPEVYQMMLKHNEVLQEVLNIESAIVKLTAQTSPRNSQFIFNSIREALGFDNKSNETKVVSMDTKKSNWFAYTGWAASIVLAGGLLWMVNQNQTLNSQIETVETDKEFLEIQIENINSDLADTKQILNVFRDKNIITVPLAGQAVYPEGYAKVYWDKSDNTVFLDLQGLPSHQKAKSTRSRSLTLNPLTPTSLGTIDNFVTDTNKIFRLENANASQAFGITLEPAGGSASPTMEQLYTLGVIDA
ncbi:anti-sigma factor [Lacinutrix neustonica]|uniref:Anti-sigma factor n=1 Tax=Lacinutrix neustonica TaxID=2980107 RepID=A0A9E8MYG5_9FLAO|nr:anti-sigma factor [Lacinutrix neustonica]WAC03204.1 anti-sigma factor [Lacinutrix neustonica]